MASKAETGSAARLIAMPDGTEPFPMRRSRQVDAGLSVFVLAIAERAGMRGEEGIQQRQVGRLVAADGVQVVAGGKGMAGWQHPFAADVGADDAGVFPEARDPRQQVGEGERAVIPVGGGGLRRKHVFVHGEVDIKGGQDAAQPRRGVGRRAAQRNPDKAGMPFVGKRLVLRRADPQDTRHPWQFERVTDPVATRDDPVFVGRAVAVMVKEDHRQWKAQGAQPGIGHVVVVPRPPKEEGGADAGQGRLQGGEGFRCGVKLASGSGRDVQPFMRQGAQAVLPRERIAQVEDRKAFPHAHPPDWLRLSDARAGAASEARVGEG